MDVMLDDLVQDSEKLLMDVQGYTDLPYLTRSLDQMKSFGDKLFLSRGPRSDVQAARLLGSKISYELPEHLSSKLESLSAAVPTEPAPAPKFDIQTYLKSERENALLNVISMTQDSLFENVDARTERTLRSWWEQEAASVLSALASSSGPLDTDLLHHTTSAQPSIDRTFSLEGDSGAGNKRSSEELNYSDQVRRFISAPDTGRQKFGVLKMDEVQPKNLLRFLTEANSSDTNEDMLDSPRRSNIRADLVEIWNLFHRFAEFIAQTPTLNESSQHCVIERRNSAGLQRGLIECSLIHLEGEFVRFMRTTIMNNRRLAKLGGRPTTRALVKAYLNIVLPPELDSAGNESLLTSGERNNIEFEDGQVDSKPVWPFVYYCLRAGDTKAAIEIASMASSSLETFATILEEYVSNGRHLSASSFNRFRQNYLQPLKSFRDPYKRLVFSILGLGSANDSHAEIIQSIDDFVWFKLSLIAAQSIGPTSQKWATNEEVLTLSRLQTLLYETYGEVHFDAWSQPLMYFKLLCLTLQFEAAIGFLARFEALRCHAVHIALGLHNRHLLLLSESLQAPLVVRDESDPVGFRRLNLARVVMLYTRKFEMSDPTEALMYFQFLSDLKCSEKSRSSDVEDSVVSEQSVFTMCVTELVLATKQFDLLGSISDSGVRKAGAIDAFCRNTEQRQELISAVALALETRGLLVEAVSIYHLAACSGRMQRPYYEKAISLANHLLSGLAQVDSQTVTGSRAASYPDRTVVLRIITKLAQGVRTSDLFQEFVLSSPSGDSAFCWSGIKTLFYLLDLANFFDMVQIEQWQTAVDQLDGLGLFPTSAQFEQVESKVNGFNELPDYVRRPLPAVLIAYMRCMLALAKKHKSSRAMEDSSNSTLADIRVRAKALIAYVGRIPYKLSSDIYARLTQMHMEIV